MYLSLHTTVAIATSNYLPNLWLAFIVNFILHFVLDLIPHGDDEDSKKIIGDKTYNKTFITITLIDLLTSSAIIWYYAWTQNFNVSTITSWSILGGVLPDLVMGFAFFAKLHPWIYKLNHWWTDKYLDFHKKIHFIIKFQMSKITALFLQAATIVLIFWFI